MVPSIDVLILTKLYDYACWYIACEKTIGHSGYWAWVTSPGDNESGRLTVCQNWIDRMLHDPHMITSTCLIHWICYKISVYL